MSAKNTPKKFAMQGVFEILLRDRETKKILAYLEECKTTGLENAVEMVYPTGGQGNVYVGAAFAHSRRATLNVENAVWNTEVLAYQNGTEIVTTNVDVVEYETKTIAASSASTTFTTAYSAIGATGSEIGYIYAVDDDGNITTAYTQATTAGEGTFSYANTTVTFNTNVSGTFKYAYTRAVDTSTTTPQMMTIETDSIPKSALVTAYGLVRDVCDDTKYLCQINGVAQIDGNFTIEGTADGDPSVHSMKLEFIKPCNSKHLYDFVIYDETD